MNFEDIKKRFAELSSILPELSLADFSEYQLLLSEYNILKPLIDDIEKIEKNEVEISNLNVLLPGLGKDELSDYKVWISDLEAENKKLVASIESIKFKKKKSKKKTAREDEIQVHKLESPRRGRKDFSESIKRIKRKEWSDIKDSWINFIPTSIIPGQPPSLEIEELVEFETLAKEIITIEEQTPAETQLNTVFETKTSILFRELFFRKAIYLFHKASHVVSAGQLHAQSGIQSWSLSSAYQGAFLGVKSILHFLGLGFSAYEGNSLLLDIWRKADLPDENHRITVGVIRYGHEIGHRHIWQLFKRVLNSYRIEIWNERFVDALRKVDEKDFSKQRNNLNYWGNDWIYDDLHQYLTDSDFGVYTHGLEHGIKSYQDKSDFSMAMSLIILSLAKDLIDDLAKNTNALTAEAALIDKFIREDSRHPIYLRNFG